VVPPDVTTGALVVPAVGTTTGAELVPAVGTRTGAVVPPFGEETGAELPGVATGEGAGTVTGLLALEELEELEKLMVTATGAPTGGEFGCVTGT